MDWSAIIISALGGGILSGAVMTFFTVKPQRKKIIAEAGGLEMKNIHDALTVLKGAYDETIKQMDKRVDALQDEMKIIHKKLDYKVIAIRQAYNCEIPADQCPVLRKQKQMDGEADCMVTTKEKNIKKDIK